MGKRPSELSDREKFLLQHRLRVTDNEALTSSDVYSDVPSDLPEAEAKIREQCKQSLHKDGWREYPQYEPEQAGFLGAITKLFRG